jgi:5-methylcytosine-specific restriction protein B
MDALNEAICPKDNNNSDKKGIEGLSSAYHIGASYFLKLAKYKKDDGTFDYDKLWDYHLKGLLSEYLRGMPDAEEKLYALRKAFDIKTSDSTQS